MFRRWSQSTFGRSRKKQLRLRKAKTAPSAPEVLRPRSFGAAPPALVSHTKLAMIVFGVEVLECPLAFISLYKLLG